MGTNSFSKVVETTWDAVVVGAGVGGSTAAFELAQRGLKVLIIEKGPAVSTSPSDDSLPLWQKTIFDKTNGVHFHPFLGEGVGGSSRVYGMVMERLEKDDFESGQWPGSFQDWGPYFDRAEEIFRVKQVTIPSTFAIFQDHLKKQNVAVKPLNLSIQSQVGCQFCQGSLCRQECKVDAWTGPLSSIADKSSVTILSDAIVIDVVHTQERATGVRIQCQNREEVINAHSIYLAAGALQTPYILYRSKSPFYPQGLGATSGQLGRNLMRHYVDLYILAWPGSEAVKSDKVLSISQFYKDPETGQKLGVFQSFGSLPPMKYVVEEFLTEQPLLKWVPGIKFIVKNVAKSLFSTPVMASIVEDSPLQDNRLHFSDMDPFAVSFSYKIPVEDHEKIKRVREIGKSLFGPFLKKANFEAENNKRLAHACGTCVMGESIGNSIVNQQSRLHELENIFIVDSSVFPTSTGKNPSLIIAANALRTVDLALR